MNVEQVKSILTTGLGMVGSFLAGWSATQGGFFVANWETISGVILALGVLVYKAIANTDGKVIQAAAGLDSVKKVVVNDEGKADDLSKPGAVVSTK